MSEPLYLPQAEEAFAALRAELAEAKAHIEEDELVIGLLSSDENQDFETARARLRERFAAKDAEIAELKEMVSIGGAPLTLDSMTETVEMAERVKNAEDVRRAREARMQAEIERLRAKLGEK